MLPSQQEKPFEWDVQFSKSASDEVVVIVDARNMSDRITSELLNCSVIFFDAKSEIIKSTHK